MTQGTTNFSYDALGRENFSSKKIDGDYYNILRQYDQLNRLSSLEYPDQTKVFYSYNLAGQIEKISTMHMDFVPSAPQLNEAIASDQQVFLSWEERPGAFGYKIKYGIEDGVYTEEIDALDAINYNVSALQNNTTYYFVIVAYNNYGESLPSNQEVATPLSSPVGYWAFEETSGPVIDSSGHEHHGTSVNVQRGQPGIIGNAYHFDGTSYVELGESLIPTGQADTQSVSFWFKYENCPTGYCSIIGQANSADNNHLNIQLKSSTYEIWNWKKNHSQNVSAWNDGSWHHVVYIHRANDLAGNDSYYFDGQLVNTIVSTGSWAEQTTLWRIGLNSVGHHPFVGFLDEVRIYDREVTPQEVGAFYHSGNARMKNKVKNESLKNKIEHDNIRPAQNDSLIVRYVQYNARGQIIKIIYGNSVETRYFYDDLTGRLNRVYSLSLRGNAGIHFRNNSSDRRQIEDVIEDSAYTAIQDLQYYYDSVGNIITIVDNVHNVIKTFSYDALNRLVFAQREEAGLVSYQKTYAYDAIGNILQKDGISFTYGENNAGPHAVTSLSDGTVLAYDENGNMSQIVRPGEIIQYHYDTENH
nr:hypothetical protein [Candidatus Omnitrophota bacterium]